MQDWRGHGFFSGGFRDQLRSLVVWSVVTESLQNTPEKTFTGAVKVKSGSQ